MSTSFADMRMSLVSGSACVAGAVLVPVVPFVGFPLCAAALAGLVYRGRGTMAAFVAGLAVAAAALLFGPGDVAILIPGLVAVLIAVSGVREYRALSVGTVMVPVMALSLAMGELANAWMLGLSYHEYVAEIAAVMEPAMQGLSTAEAMAGESLVDVVIRFAPSGYFVIAVLTVIPTMMAIGWAARSAKVEVSYLPRLDRVDLTPHVLWLPIVALGALAAGRFLGEPEGTVATIGLNILLAARVALFIQGVGVLSAWLHKRGVGPFGRMAAYTAAFLVDATTWVVSMVGLIDFWANTRKLERGAGGSAPEEGSLVE